MSMVLRLLSAVKRDGQNSQYFHIMNTTISQSLCPLKWDDNRVLHLQLWPIRLVGQKIFLMATALQHNIAGQCSYPGRPLL